MTNREGDRERQRRYASRAIDRGDRLYKTHRGADPRSDEVDNYWGMHAQARDFPSRNPDAWWNTTGGRHDYTDARRPREQAIPRAPAFDWIEDRDYSWDPGYAYEFGMDLDFLNDVDSGAPRRPASRDRPREQDQGAWAGFEYGWRGEPNRQRAVYREVWNAPGPYQGMGPRNYQRADARIKEEICEILTANGRIDPSDLTIEVNQGEVTLSGAVHRREEKYLAEDIAASVSGVKDVHSAIRTSRDQLTGPGAGRRARRA